MTLPTPHLRAMLDAFERRGISVKHVIAKDDGGKMEVSGATLVLRHFASGVFRAAALAPGIVILGEGETAEEAIAAAISEARAVADEFADALTIPDQPEAPRSTP